MNKAELISIVSEKNNVTRTEVEKIVNSVLNTITEELADGGRVQLVGFGTFEVKQCKARMGRNPRTSEVVEIPAAVVPVFRAGKSLKNQVAK